MESIFIQNKRVLSCLIMSASLLFQGCAMQWGADIQWDSKSQILQSEDSQVKMRALQTRVFDTTDRVKVLHAAVNTLQDLYFDIDVLNEDLGILSGKKLYPSGSRWENHPTYYRYQTDELILFSTNYLTYGPFQYRKDLTRITVTIRPKGKTQLRVRASIQYNIRAVEDPELYQKFFKTLSQSMFLAAQTE
jgi:hypothetical protein